MKKAIAKRAGIRHNRDAVIRDLTRTRLPLEVIGRRYGVTRQALSIFMKRAGIERPLRPSRHQVDSCPVCQGLLRISQIPHSEFLTFHTIRDKLGPGISYERYLHHLKILKEKGLVNPKFGCLHSRKLERAYAIYFTKKLPVYEIGSMTGLKNFGALIRQHRQRGWDVPPPLFIYHGKERSRVLKGIRHWSQDGRHSQKKGTP